jgi:predicted PurR-regulated permease PerM
MNPSFERPFTFDRVVRIIIAVVVAIGLYLLLHKLSSVLLPFLLAWLLAYLMHPIVCLFQYKLKLKNRILSIFFAILSVTLVIALLDLIIIPPVINEISRTSGLFSVYVKHIQSVDFLPVEVKNYLIQWMNHVDLNSLLSKDNITFGFESLGPKFMSILSGSLDLLISFFLIILILIYTLFILVDYEKITDGWLELVPLKYRNLISQMLQDLEDGMNSYFRGQALISLIEGVLFAIGFELIDLPLGLLLGLLMGALTMIPYLKVIMFPPLAFFAFLKSIETGQSFWPIIMWIAIIFLIIQGLEAIILTPKILGKTMGMNPAVILLSLSVWGALLGVAGMIIALPVTTIIVSYYKRFILGSESWLNPEPHQGSSEFSDKDVG